jgi:hypothetical protein
MEKSYVRGVQRKMTGVSIHPDTLRKTRLLEAGEGWIFGNLVSALRKNEELESV